MPKTTYFSNALIDHALRGPGSAFPGPALARFDKPYIGLFLTSPTIAGGGLEVSGSGYARQPISFGAPANGSSLSAVDVLFARASAWGTLISFGILDSPTDGHLLYFGPLPTPLPVIVGDTLRIPAGQVALAEF